MKKEEIDLIAKKKALPADEYKKTLNQLREKNIKFQKKEQTSLGQLLYKGRKQETAY